MLRHRRGARGHRELLARGNARRSLRDADGQRSYTYVDITEADGSKSRGGEIKQPEKNIPRAFFTSGALTACLYVFATVGILLSLSLHKLTLVQGLVDTFKAIFGSDGVGEAAVYVLGIGTLYMYFTNMTTWSMGANRAVAEAAMDGELPSFFARADRRRGTKVVAALAAVATFVIAATALFFMWPEIPHRPADWSYTGPLLGIVAGALIIGKVLIWSGLHRTRAAKPPKTPSSPPASALPSHP